MITSALIDGRPYTFNTEDESQVIGEGGEAIVMKWTPSQEFTRKYGDVPYLVKLFFEDTPLQVAAAKMRQKKLPQFPKNLRRNAISPICFATDPRTGRIIGIVLPLVDNVKPLVKLMDKKYRKEVGFTQEDAAKVLINLHALILGVHRAGVVIGDFNDKNVLVNIDTLEVFLIDVDSAQWGTWTSLVATAEFSDPTLLDQDQNLLRGARYSQTSDWYSFTVMVYQLFTLSHPYRDGVHRPKRKPGAPREVRQNFSERVASRLSVFDPTVHLDTTGVKRPHRPASLPEELGLFMRDVFVSDRRETPFPITLLTAFQWMTCPACGREHGRVKCPSPQCGAPGFPPLRTNAQPRPAAPPPPPSATPAPSGPAPAAPAATPRDTQFITTATQGGKLLYVHYQDGAYRREDGAVAWRRPHQPGLSVFIAGNRTVFGAGSEVAIVNGSARPTQLKTQQTFNKPTVAANGQFVYWMDGSSLMRDDGNPNTITIGSILPNMTSVWVGEQFGVALVQAGVITQALVFDAARAGFQGSYNLPIRIGAQVIDATCIVNDSYAWLVVTYRTSKGVQSRTCYVLNRSGQLLATVSGQNGNTWLRSISSAALAVGDKLLVPVTGTGITRVGIAGSTLQSEGTYRGSAQIVTDTIATVGLCLTPRGLVHIGRTKLTRVTTS